MDDPLEAIEKQVGSKRNFDSPPLHLWHPDLSGDIPIVIKSDGSWFHDGGRIKRDSLVRLFASILRREEDGDYYLVTPGEKWRIQVELHALVVTDIDREGELLSATLNTGKKVLLDKTHSLFLEPALGNVAALVLDHGLSAVFSRAAWLRLVDMAEEVEGRPIIRSGDYSFSLDEGL
jgi:hypothetical protein